VLPEILTKGAPRDAHPVAPRGWRSGCPVCGHHDKVRLLNAVYQDRERRRAEQPPLVNRYGLMVRGHPGLARVAPGATRLSPPRRPSALATFMRIGGPQVAGLLGVPFGVALLIRPDTSAEFVLSLVVAALLGALSLPLGERVTRAWSARTAEWEQAMRAWRALRYCSRCDQVFLERR
jgi:hypothetical protein